MFLILILIILIFELLLNPSNHYPQNKNAHNFLTSLAKFLAKISYDVLKVLEMRPDNVKQYTLIISNYKLICKNF